MILMLMAPCSLGFQVHDSHYGMINITILRAEDTVV